MRLFYFFTLLIILLGLGIGSFYFSHNFLSLFRNSLYANLQANLLVLQNYEAENIIQNPIRQEKPITMVFVGDIMLDRGVESIISGYNNFRYPFMRTVDVLKNADLAFGNLEGPISDGGQKQGSIYSFRFSPEAVEGLKFAGFDVLSLANNHILDYGREALKDTISILKENNINIIGAGDNYLEANNSLVKEINGVKIVFLGYALMNPKSYEASKDYSGTSSFELERVKNEVRMLKDLGIADIVIVSFHWGEEYQTRSNKNQQEIGRVLAEAGADLIIGHHPHVVQEVERYKDSWIAYSLGNFIFDQNFSEETMSGLMLKAKIQSKKVENIEPIEIKINNSFQPWIFSRN